jgi:hypothetical protein
MIIKLTVRRFKARDKKVDKKKSKIPEETYEGDVHVQENDDVTVDLACVGGDECLSVKVLWNNHDQSMFCFCSVKKERIHFTLRTKSPTGEYLARNTVRCRSFETGRYANWSASMMMLSQNIPHD